MDPIRAFALQIGEKPTCAAAGIEHRAGNVGQGIGETTMQGTIPPHARLDLVHQSVLGGFHGGILEPFEGRKASERSKAPPAQGHGP